MGDTNLTVGENATILCYSDLTVERVEWIFDGDVVVTSNNSQRADLVFSSVQEFLHNREYVCRAVTSYGTLERRITISVYSKQFSALGYLSESIIMYCMLCVYSSGHGPVVIH